MVTNNYFFNLRNLSFRHRKRKRKQRKRHAETFFNSRLKKFAFYYYKFSSSELLKQQTTAHLTFKTQLAGIYKIGIKSINMTYLTIYPLRSIIKVSKRYSRVIDIEDNIKYKMSVFPDFWLTAKPKAVRMGKGKGARSRKIYFLKKGEILYELRFIKKNSSSYKNKKNLKFIVNMYMKLLLLRLQHKFSIKNIITKKIF